MFWVEFLLIVNIKIWWDGLIGVELTARFADVVVGGDGDLQQLGMIVV